MIYNPRLLSKIYIILYFEYLFSVKPKHSFNFHQIKVYIFEQKPFSILRCYSKISVVGQNLSKTPIVICSYQPIYHTEKSSVISNCVFCRRQTFCGLFTSTKSLSKDSRIHRNVRIFSVNIQWIIKTLTTCFSGLYRFIFWYFRLYTHRKHYGFCQLLWQ